jgi:hypothetical protein
MGGIGLIMDATKVIAPFLVFFFWAHKKYLRSAFAAVLTFALSAVSFTASISAIEDRIDDVREVSQKALAVNNQQSFLMTQVEDYQTLAREQRLVGHLTASKETLSRVDGLLSKVETINQAASNGAVDKTVVKYGREITIACALLIECVSILMAMALHNSFNLNVKEANDSAHSKEHLNNILNGLLVVQEQLKTADERSLSLKSAELLQPTRALNLDEPLLVAKTQVSYSKNGLNGELSENVKVSVATLIDEGDQVVLNSDLPLVQDAPSKDSQPDELSAQSLIVNSVRSVADDTILDCDKSLEFKIRDAVTSQLMIPSIRGLKAIGAKRELVNRVLAELETEGVLEDFRRGYRIRASFVKGSAI